MRRRLAFKNYYSGALVLMLLMGAGSCAPFMVKNNFRGGHDSQCIRILLLATRSEFTVSSTGGFRVSGKDSVAGQHAIRFKPEEIIDTMSIEPINSPIMLNGNPYRGNLEIVRSNNVIQVINILRIDEYLASVVPGEIPSGWDREALKAQAVAARTYAYYHLANSRKTRALFDLDATVNSQVYRGICDEKQSTTEAVIGTSGEIIAYENRPIVSYFHSTCGGKTSDEKYVWNNNGMPYLRSVQCGFCNDSTKFKWESRLTLDEIRKYVSAQNPAIGAIRAVTFRRNNNRVAGVFIKHGRGMISITGNNFRLMFPPEKIKSLYFTSKKISNGLLLTGYGWGHGVGMCQWGARGMALRGYNYHDILKHYYTGVTITNLRNTFLASKRKNSFTLQ